MIDIESVIESDLGQPWASYLLQVMPQKTALAILALTIICAFSMGQGCMVRRTALLGSMVNFDISHFRLRHHE